MSAKGKQHQDPCAPAPVCQDQTPKCQDPCPPAPVPVCQDQTPRCPDPCQDPCAPVTPVNPCQQQGKNVKK